MENLKKYAAFISYRHCPLDIAVAESLHKMIERYQVPRELRSGSERHIGKVFRDRDELPLSNNLTEDIYTALDHSEFLIVICTPDTPKSKWVDREIEYFISKHGRNRVLTVLASGTPEESIPPRITCDYGADGSVIAEYEPLCAYLVAPAQHKILKNLRSEFLRLMAAMLNCPYDALRQRQKRYRMQQLTALMGVVTAVALVFVLMLSNRNREISNKNQEILQKNDEISAANQQIAQQLLESQINESKALTLLSKQQLDDGARLEALESALNALPHDGDGRPYSAAAESALTNALNIYSTLALDYYVTIEQPTDICWVRLSEDGRSLITLDTLGCMRCFDPMTTALRWESSVLMAGWREYDTDMINLFEVLDDQQLVMYSNTTDTYAFSLETGALVNHVRFFSERMESGYSSAIMAILSPDGSVFAQYSNPWDHDVGLESTDGSFDSCHYLEVYDSATFQLIKGLVCEWGEESNIETPTFSLDGRYLAVPFFIPRTTIMELYILDTATWEVTSYTSIEAAEGSLPHNIYVAWLPGNQLILSYEQRTSYQEMNTYFVKISTDGTQIPFGPVYTYRPDTNSIETDHHLTDTHIYYTVDLASVFAVNLDTLQIEKRTHDMFVDSYLRSNENLMLICQDGSIVHWSASTGNNSSYQIYQFDQPTLTAAGVSGETEILCLVPENTPNTVVVVTTPQFKESITVQKPDMNAYRSRYRSYFMMDYILFPSGNAFLVCDEIDSDTPAAAYTIYNAKNLEIMDSFVIETEEELYFSGFSADETKLLFRGYIYDLTNHTLSPMEDGQVIYESAAISLQTPALYTQAPDTPLRSAFYSFETNGVYWWQDGITPKSSPIPYDKIPYCGATPYTAISASGGYGIQSFGNSGLWVHPLFDDYSADRTSAYGILSTDDAQWHLLENPVSSHGFPIFAVGNKEKIVAFADFDRTLRIYDFNQDAIVRQFALTVAPDSILSMQLLADDRYLLIFTAEEVLHLVNLQNGTELGTYYLEYSSTPSTVSVYVHDGIAYLMGIDTTLRIDLQTGEVLATIPDMVCFLPESSQALQIDRLNNQLTAISIHPWQTLSQKGWTLLNMIADNKIT